MLVDRLTFRRFITRAATISQACTQYSCDLSWSDSLPLVCHVLPVPLPHIARQYVAAHAVAMLGSALYCALRETIDGECRRLLSEL